MSLAPAEASPLAAHYRAVRRASERLAAPLGPEDCQAQSMELASPVKWHLAHTTWFFEEFVLEPFMPGYERWHHRDAFLYNSYYNQVGQRVARGARGLMTRPSLAAVREFRAHVDRAVDKLLHDESLWEQTAERIELGLHHEQQHQELILTDLKHLFAQNPLYPAYRRAKASGDGHDAAAPPVRWVSHAGGLMEIGHDAGDGFVFDNETPRHLRYLEPFQAASRLVTCGEYLRFMEDGGYEQSALWLSDGWDAAQRDRWRAPLYWVWRDGRWMVFTLDGLRAIDPAEPVCHVSYFEADAFARWTGARLLREEEWEHAARGREASGNFVEAGHLHPRPATRPGRDDQVQQMFGDVWEWTQSQYTAYPGYQAPAGALGEYNGKFMCNQFVLRGGSCATPASHIRATYRNFFPPDARWQFTGIRLAAM